jgi:hypothetical protein
LDQPRRTAEIARQRIRRGAFKAVAELEAAMLQDERHQGHHHEHRHFDHVGDLASFQKDAPGAKTYVNERDAPALESGGNVDYRRAEGRGIISDPIKVDVRTKPGDHNDRSPG